MDMSQLKRARLVELETREQWTKIGGLKMAALNVAGEIDEKLDLRMGFAGGAGGKDPTSCVDRRRVSGGSLRKPAEALC